MLVLFLVAALAGLTRSANILAVTTLGSPSHHVFNDAYLLELANRGHNVTLLGHENDSHHHPNYTHVVLEGLYEKVSRVFDPTSMRHYNTWQSISVMWEWAELLCEFDHDSDGFRTIVDYPSGFRFDLVVWDMSTQLCWMPLVDKFGRPPVVMINPFINQPNSFRNVYQSYLPWMVYPFTDHMTLWQRLRSNFWTIVCEISRHFVYIPNQKKLAEKYFGQTRLTVEEFERNITLLLANYNPVFNYVEVLPANIVPVGGLHIKPRPLPKDIKEVLDKAENGVILVSFGTNLKVKNFGQDRLAAILGALSRLNRTVFWKCDDPDLDVPENVITKRWLPQNDILGHPNTVLFITHCGLLSSHEAMYNGVPVVGVPFYLDQSQNAGNFRSKRMGEMVDFDSITEDSFLATIAKVLDDKSYFENAKRLSRLYKDQETAPLDRAIYWTEYVLRHGTAEHLSLATRDMNFLQMYNLDLVLVLILALAITLTIPSYLIYVVFNRKFRITKLKTA